MSFTDAVAAKMEDGNIRAAGRLLMSEDKPVETSAELGPSWLRSIPPHQQIDVFLFHHRKLLQFQLMRLLSHELFVHFQLVLLAVQTASDYSNFRPNQLS